MSSIPNSLPTTSTSGTSSTTGAGALTSNDFMNLMLKELQNQDPLNPTDSNALLQQISQISTLQSNQQLQTSLTSMTLQQTIGAAGNLIGKSVAGIDANGNQASGNVKSVQVQNQQVYLNLDSGSVLPMANVIGIAPAIASTTAVTAAGTTPGATTPVSTSALGNLASALSALGI